MEALENVKETIDTKMGKTTLQLLKNSVPVEAEVSFPQFFEESIFRAHPKKNLLRKTPNPS